MTFRLSFMFKWDVWLYDVTSWMKKAFSFHFRFAGLWRLFWLFCSSKTCTWGPTRPDEANNRVHHATTCSGPEKKLGQCDPEAALEHTCKTSFSKGATPGCCQVAGKETIGPHCLEQNSDTAWIGVKYYFPDRACLSVLFISRSFRIVLHSVNEFKGWDKCSPEIFGKKHIFASVLSRFKKYNDILVIKPMKPSY